MIRTLLAQGAFFFQVYQPTQACRRQSNHRGSYQLRVKNGRARSGVRILLAMKNSAKIESVIVGIFDNAQDLDQADERLAAAGFEGTVYDEAIVAEEPSNVDPVGPVPVGPVLAPGVVPTEDLGSVESDLPTIVRAFKSHLADCHLPDDVIEAYATAFYHKGKFVIVRTEPECDKHVVKILRECGATRVNQHDLNTVV